jgi:gamma-glutamyl hydrolase
VQTDVPIYGILTQPFTDAPEKADEFGAFPDAGDLQQALNGSFILQSHVKFLEAGGARVVPVGYKYNKNQLSNTLDQLNGLYIPGDSPAVLQNERYLATVREAVQWAQNHNVEGGSHFPLVAVGYGYMALLMTAIKSKETIKALSEDDVFVSKELNLRLAPQDTYFFDGLTLNDTETQLDGVTFYNELVFNVPLKNFLQESVLSQVFVPIATFHQERANQEDEFVAMVEGAHFPFFATAFAVEKFQFNNDLSIESEIDHCSKAIKLAQRFANLFVDEARLSGNTYHSAREEYKALIQNYDRVLIADASGIVNGELYLF